MTNNEKDLQSTQLLKSITNLTFENVDLDELEKQLPSLQRVLAGLDNQDKDVQKSKAILNMLLRWSEKRYIDWTETL